MTSSAQFEHEAERTRSHLNDTMAELRSRMTVGQVADQVWDLAKDSLGGDFAKNLARQAANNPMPVALMGTGLAWLMFAPTRERRTTRPKHIERASRVGDGLGVPEDEPEETATTESTVRRVRKSVKRTAQDTRDAAAATGAAISESYEAVAEGASGLASAASEAAQQGAESVRETASSAYEAIKRRAAAAQDIAASTYEQVKEGAMQTTDMANSSAKAARDYAADTAQSIADFCVENPLVIIGAGVALGAIAGAVLPMTEMEDDLMGETSDQLKQQAEQMVASQVEKVERVGEQIVDHATESAAREFAPDDVDAQIQDTGRPLSDRGDVAMP